MNKIKLFVLAAVMVFAAGNVSAQKTGYISLDQVVGLLPETAKLDSALRRYQSDSLTPQFTYFVQEYNRKDSMVNTKDSAKISPQVRNQVRQEMEQLAYQIQNWQSIQQQALQGKQAQLLGPIYDKVEGAIQQVAKENGYTYVMNREVLIVMPPGDDLLPLVAKKLNLKLPNASAAANTAAPKK